jgi:hypothetical protein
MGSEITIPLTFQEPAKQLCPSCIKNYPLLARKSAYSHILKIAPMFNIFLSIDPLKTDLIYPLPAHRPFSGLQKLPSTLKWVNPKP